MTTFYTTFFSSTFSLSLWLDVPFFPFNWHLVFKSRQENKFFREAKISWFYLKLKKVDKFLDLFNNCLDCVDVVEKEKLEVDRKTKQLSSAHQRPILKFVIRFNDKRKKIRKNYFTNRQLFTAKILKKCYWIMKNKLIL